MTVANLTAAIAKANFLRVVAYYKLPDDEIDLCKQLYRADPDSWRACFASIAALLPSAPYDDGGGWVKITPGTVGQQQMVKRA
jgi:hypothetical protein